MRRSMVVIFSALCCATMTGRPASAFELIETLWYAGDIDTGGGFINYIPSSGTQFEMFESFEVTDPDGWRVRQVWSNGFSQFVPTVTFAEWSIREGMGPGNGGSIVMDGVGGVTPTATGRFHQIPMAQDYPEYEFRVLGLDFVLPPGTYWLNVTPLGGELLISPTSGANGVGTPIGANGGALWWWSDLFHNYDAVAEGFSMGVAGAPLPEPGASLASIVALAALAVCGARSRVLMRSASGR